MTITAFGAAGTLASTTFALTGQTLTLLNTASVFGGLAGITGYRFTTTAADPLDATYGRAYVIADDFTFIPAVPEPSTATFAMFGLAALVVPRVLRSRRTRRNPPIPERKTT